MHRFKAFPDRHSTIVDIIAEGDKVFVRTTAQGTHQDKVPGIPIDPTEKRITWTVWEVFRFTGDRIVERRGIHNLREQLSTAAGLEQAGGNALKDDAIGRRLSKRVREFAIHLLVYATVMFFVFYVLLALFLGLDFITWIVGVAWGVGVAFHGLSLFVPSKVGK